MSVLEIGKWIVVGTSVVVIGLIALYTALILGGLFAHWIYNIFMFGWRMF
jgi:hypothetical protein